MQVKESGKNVCVTQDTTTNSCGHARGRLHAVYFLAVTQADSHSSTHVCLSNASCLQCSARAVEKGALGQTRRRHLVCAAPAGFALLFPDKMCRKRTGQTATQPPFRPSSHILTNVVWSSNLLHELECGLDRNKGLDRHHACSFSTCQDLLNLLQVKYITIAPKRPSMQDYPWIMTRA